MTVGFALILATVLLAIAGYAQYRIAFHTAPSRVALARDGAVKKAMRYCA
jgi:hypothetical protein